MTEVDVIKGLAAQAATIPGMRIDPVFPIIGNAIEPPFFGVQETDEVRHQTFGPNGLIDELFTCGIFVSRGDPGRGAAALCLFTSRDGPNSVPTALEADQTLGGAAKALIVERIHGKFRTYTIGNTDYLGAMLDVRVWY